MGSFAGTEPGLVFGAWKLPLNPDAYFFLVLNEPDQLPASGFLGVLDDAGDAQAQLILAPGQVQALVGSTVHHAFAAFDIWKAIVSFASNPVSLTFTP
jgi:hypothetical protein